MPGSVSWHCRKQQSSPHPRLPRCCLPTARIGIRSRANRDRRREWGRPLPAFRGFRSNLWRRLPCRRPSASACQVVRPGARADRSRALRHAAGLDGAGTLRGQALRESGSPGPIVERLGLNRSNWVETVRGFGRLFKQAAGRSSSLVDAAAAARGAGSRARRRLEPPLCRPPARRRAINRHLG